MTGVSEEDKALLLRFNITQTTQIQLTRLQVYTYSDKGAKPHKCKLCKYSSKSKSSVEVHLRTHTGVKPFACNLCNYKSSQRSNVNNHIITHTGEKYFNCAFCAKSFTRNGDKIRHETICKVNDPSWVEMQKMCKCQLCAFSTARISSLKRHMMIHTGEKPFQCTLCSQKFGSRTYLQRHIFTHTHEKPNKCQFCTRGFAQVTPWKSHEKICKLNPKQGDSKWVEEQKKFKCHFCRYRSTTKGNLEMHLRSHTGEKPFNCPLCLYKCSQRSSINSHLRRIHLSKNGYKCRECDFATLSTSKLLKHATESHLKL